MIALGPRKVLAIGSPSLMRLLVILALVKRPRGSFGFPEYGNSCPPILILAGNSSQ